MKRLLRAWFAGCIVAFSPAALAGAAPAAALVGAWVQADPDASGQKRYEFRSNASYEFRLVSPSSAAVREDGTYWVDGTRLVLAPRSGRTRRIPYRLEQDAGAARQQLVMEQSAGQVVIYHRE